MSFARTARFREALLLPAHVRSKLRVSADLCSSAHRVRSERPSNANRPFREDGKHARIHLQMRVERRKQRRTPESQLTSARNFRPLEPARNPPVQTKDARSRSAHETASAGQLRRLGSTRGL